MRGEDMYLCRPGAPAPFGPRGVVNRRSLFFRQILRQTAADSFRKLDPRVQIRNPVMFVVLIGTVVTLIESIVQPSVFSWLATVWLGLTVLFANFAEAMAEGRGKARADTLRRTRTDSRVRRQASDGTEQRVATAALSTGDVVVCEAGDVIPSDGEILVGAASVDESVITGESAPVIRESGGDRCVVTGGTRVLSDRIVIRITAEPGQTFLDRMISVVEGATRRKTPNEIALAVLLAALAIIFIPVVVTLRPMAGFFGTHVSVVILTALLVCLIPTTIAALLSAIGIAGMDRLVQRNVLAMSGRAVEAAADVQTLLLEKTGTITLGNRMAAAFHPVGDYREADLAAAAQLASIADETPEGRSIVVLAKQRCGLRERDLCPSHTVVPFASTTRMSGMDTGDRRIRMGAADSVKTWVIEQGGVPPTQLDSIVERVANLGATPLVVADGRRVLGVIELKDVVKSGIADRFAELRASGIRPVMITGDNSLTAAAIAQEAGVRDYLAEATPDLKLQLVKAEQDSGKLVAMTGDGTDDARALARADVGLAMNTGTSATKEVGNMVDLDSNPTKLIEIVESGKRLLIARGALTTFSLASDVAKYFAIIPALFLTTFPQLRSYNIMGLHNPASAVLSAVIFNALVIVALIPLTLRGVRFRPSSATAILRRNVLVYGMGGLIVPFIGIKLIDLILTALHVH
jgi:potassium-transporting ATPase ATP-binding subunit